MDDAPLEERRVRAVQTRRGAPGSDVEETGALDASAIARVRDEARPDPRDADELHDALMTAGFLDETELAAYEPGVGGRSDWWRPERHDCVCRRRAPARRFSSRPSACLNGWHSTRTDSSTRPSRYRHPARPARGRGPRPLSRSCAGV